MVTIKAMESSAGAAAYFQKQNSREGYYDREKSGVWIGKTCASVGITEGAAVNIEQFKNILDGKTASGVSILRAGGQERTHRAGLDITVFPDPSFSAYAATSAEAEQRVDRWRSEATAEIVTHIERELVQARVTNRGSTDRINTGNIVAAMFEHETTRPVNGAPVIGKHTHIVIANVTETTRGMRAISNEKMLDRAHLIAVFENALAAAARRDGFSASMFRPEDARGRSLYARLDGVPEAAREALSQRSAQIDARAAELREQLWAKYPGRDFTESEIRAMATVDSREATRTFTEAEVQAAFDSALASKGLTREQIVEGVQLQQGREWGERQAVDIVRQAVSTDNLTEAQAVFGVKDILTTASELSKGDCGLADLRAGISELIDKGEIVQLDKETLTTAEMLKTEQRIAERFEAGKGQVQAIGRREAVENFLDHHYSFLSDEQREAVIAPLVGADRFTACRGVAGAGKSTMARAIADYCATQGVTVEGAAFMATAGQNLGRKAGIAAGTVHGALMKDFTPGSLQIVDEFSQLGTMQTAELIAKAEAAGARVLFLGDDRQLVSQAAGAPIVSAIREGRIATKEIAESQRQKTPEMREIARALHEKNVPAAFAAMQKHGCIIQCSADRAEARRQVVDRYFMKKDEGKETQIYTPLHRDREAINNAIRARMQERGELGEGLRVTVREPSNLRSAQRHHSANYQIGDKVFLSARCGELHRGQTLEITGIDHQKNALQVVDKRGELHAVSLTTYGQNLSAYKEKEIEISAGDKIVFLKNDAGEKGVGVTNKMTGTVTEMQPGRLTVSTEGGERIIPLDRYNFIAHGYAQTVTAAQGLDVEAAIAFLPIAGRDLAGQLGKDVTNSYNCLSVAATRMQTDFDLITNNPRELMELTRREQVKEMATDYLQQKNKGKEREQGERGRTNFDRLRKQTGEVRALVLRIGAGEFTAKDVHALRGPASELTVENTDRALYLMQQRGELKLTDGREITGHRYEQNDRTKAAILTSIAEAKEAGSRHVTRAQLIDRVKEKDEAITGKMIDRKLKEMTKSGELKSKTTDDRRELIATGKSERDKDKEREIIGELVRERADGGEPFTTKDIRRVCRELGIVASATAINGAIAELIDKGELKAEFVKENGREQAVYFGREVEAEAAELTLDFDKSVELELQPGGGEQSIQKTELMRSGGDREMEL